MECCPLSVKTILYWIYTIEHCVEPICQKCLEYYTVQCSLKSIKTTLNKIFYYAMVPGASGKTFHRVFPVQCCLKNIKAALNMTFSSALLSTASRTTLHRVFTCIMLSEADKTSQELLYVQYCSKSISWDDIAHKKAYVVSSLRLETTLHRKKLYSKLS